MTSNVSSPTTRYRSAGRPGVSQAAVDRAADALLQQGHRPSIEKIRAAVGGSPNTLGPLLDDWWRRLAARVRVGAGAFERLPGSLAQIAEAFFLHALEEARRFAKQEEQRERDVLVREQQAVEVRSHVLTLREQELQARLQERERAVSVLELQLKDQTLLLRKLGTEHRVAQQRIEELEASIARAPSTVNRSANTSRKRSRPKRRVVTRSKKNKKTTKRPSRKRGSR